MRRSVRSLVAVLTLIILFIVAASLNAQAIPDPNHIRLEMIADGFHRPLFITHAGDGSGRLFVVEQTGFVHIIQDGKVLDESFLDVSHLVGTRFDLSDRDNNSENGLLGMAFHPQLPGERSFLHILHRSESQFGTSTLSD